MYFEYDYLDQLLPDLALASQHPLVSRSQYVPREGIVVWFYLTILS
jgi:hypothetical protein